LPTVSKVLKPLAHAGLVTGFRGASGGYAQTAAYAKASVKSIKATLGDGNDVFYVSGNVGNVPAVVDAGNGNDNLTGGYGNDTLRGGR